MKNAKSHTEPQWGGQQTKKKVVRSSLIENSTMLKQKFDKTKKGRKGNRS